LDLRATIGELEIGIKVQYGQPTEEIPPDAPATFAKKYRPRGLNIIVGFMKGRSSYEMYEKENHSTFTKEEIDSLLKSNGKDWKLLEEGIRTKNTLWESSDRTMIAVYSNTSKTLSIKLKKMFDQSR
jgi:hypothetical protein